MSEERANLEKILNRIKKMLTLGHDSGATDGERETALAMAHKLMKKFNIDAATLAAMDDSNKQDIRGRTYFFYGKKEWAINAAQAISRLFMCEFYIQTWGCEEKGKIYYYMIGSPANTATARMICEFVLAGINRQSCTASRNDGFTSKNRAAYRKSFCDAASSRIVRRVFDMLEEMRKAKESVPGTALVVQNLYEKEKELNAKWLEENTELKPIKFRESQLYDAQGYQRGDAYGKAVHLGQTVEKDADKEQLESGELSANAQCLLKYIEELTETAQSCSVLALRVKAELLSDDEFEKAVQKLVTARLIERDEFSITLR